MVTKLFYDAVLRFMRFFVTTNKRKQMKNWLSRVMFYRLNGDRVKMGYSRWRKRVKRLHDIDVMPVVFI